MDMKKILQAFDGASTKKPVGDTSDMKKFLSIISEGKTSSNRLTQAEALAVNHYTKKPQQVKETKAVASIDKYLKVVEQELTESTQLKQAKVKKLAERVIERVMPGQEVQPGINRLTGKPIEPEVKKPSVPSNTKINLTPGVEYPDTYTISYNGKEYKFAGNDKVPQDQGEIIAVSAGAVGIRGLYPIKVQLSNDGMYYLAPKTSEVKEETEGVDSVTLDIPLMIRLLEFAREDAQDDMALHQIVERMIGMKEEGQSLTMSDYKDIIGQVSEAHGNSKIYDKCWTGYKRVPGKKRNEPGSCEKK